MPIPAFIFWRAACGNQYTDVTVSLMTRQLIRAPVIIASSQTSSHWSVRAKYDAVMSLTPYTWICMSLPTNLYCGARYENCKTPIIHPTWQGIIQFSYGKTEEGTCLGCLKLEIYELCYILWASLPLMSLPHWHQASPILQTAHLSPYRQRLRTSWNTAHGCPYFPTDICTYYY